MQKYLTAGILTALLISTACVKSPMETNVSNNSETYNSNITTVAVNSNVSNKAASKPVNTNPDEKLFYGTLNDKDIEIRLSRNKDKISGTYSYLKIGKPLNLAGTIDGVGKFTLQETDESGKKTGEWKGNWTDEDGIIYLQGNFEAAGGKSGQDIYFNAIEQFIKFTNGEKLTTKNLEEENKKEKYSVSIKYPEISGVDPAVAAKFNQTAKKFADDNFAESKKAVKESVQEEMAVSADTTYNVVLANSNLVSLIYNESDFLGGAHPSSSSVSMNYDLKGNKELKLEDIFEPNSNYLKEISDYCIAKLKAKGLDNDTLTEGAAPKKENYKVWNLTEKGLLITFDAYQVASYAEGPQLVNIPFDKLKSILRKDTIVSTLMK